MQTWLLLKGAFLLRSMSLIVWIVPNEVYVFHPLQFCKIYLPEETGKFELFIYFTCATVVLLSSRNAIRHKKLVKCIAFTRNCNTAGIFIVDLLGCTHPKGLLTYFRTIYRNLCWKPINKTASVTDILSDIAEQHNSLFFFFLM